VSGGAQHPVEFPIELSRRPDDVALPTAPAPLAHRLGEALALPLDMRRQAVADVVRLAPWWSEAWAALGDLARDDIEAYACYRVGYHRGLDQLRRSGWKGSGAVRWRSPGNRGFLRCVHGLAEAAGAIGEDEERERCSAFLRQLDPDWPPIELQRPR
jgi:hypothetical protein